MIIRDKLKEFSSYKMFCTPGHKGSLLKQDITEIDGFFPIDLIQKAECETAKHYGAKHLRYLTGGSSIGVKAALMGFGDLLVQTNSHKSVPDAAELSGAKVFFINNDSENGLSLPPTKKQMENALSRFPSVGTVVLTSPDYYGFAVDPACAKAVKKAGKRLHIDAAHGAHMFFRPDLFDTGIFKYADTFNLSAHKTLPAYTQTAYLAINDSDSIKTIDQNLSRLGTTSPFYPFLAALEEAADFAAENKENFSALDRAVKTLKKRINCIKNDDFTRLVVDTKEFGQTSAEVYNMLKESGIIAERFDGRYIIFIVTVCDSADDVDMLAETLCRIRDGRSIH